MKGIVYLIRSGDNYKIGFSKNINNRIKAYKTHNPEFELIKVYEGGRDLEKDLHYGLRPFRIKGTEWFNSCSIISIPEFVEKYYNWYKKINIELWKN